MTRMVEMGRSAEGRKIMAISVSTGTYGVGRHGETPRQSEEDEEADLQKKKRKKDRKNRRPPLRDTEKLGFVIIGAQHAREVCLQHLIRQLSYRVWNSG